MTQLITVVVSGARAGRHNYWRRLTMSAHIHTRSTRCVKQRYVDRIATLLSEQAADLTAATVVSVTSPTASFSAFSWYRTRDYRTRHWLPVRIQLYKLLHGRPIALCSLSCKITDLLAAIMDCDCDRHGQHHKLATPRTRTTFGDRVFAPAGLRVKTIFPTDWCSLTMVEKTEPWSDISCISLTEILPSCCREPDIHAHLSCLSCMQTSFQPMPVMLTNRMTAE